MIRKITNFPRKIKHLKIENEKGDCFFEAFFKAKDEKIFQEILNHASKRVKPLKHLEKIDFSSVKNLNFLQKIWRLFFIEIWHVGIIEQEISDILQNGLKKPIKWLKKAPPMHYYADPFHFSWQNDDVVLMEEYSYFSRGCIINFNVKTEEAQKIINLSKHMSYPQIFEHENRLFVMPETAQNDNLMLFEFVNGKWIFVHNLLENVKLVDATIFMNQGKFWLFATDGKNPNSHLNLFFSDSLFGNWSPHPLNPVKINVFGARPAGAIIMHENKILRPAQDCSSTYGFKIRVYEITKLSTEEFEEREINLIESNDAEFSEGLHTLNSYGKSTILDAKKFVFAPLEFAKFIAHRLSEILFR